MDIVSVNGSGVSQEKKAKEYGKMVLFVLEHKTAFLLAGSMALGIYTTVQTMKSELVQVKSDVASIKDDMAFVKAVLLRRK